MAEQPGGLPERIGRFEIIDVVGEGAMGAVYAARDLRLARTVAIKVLKSPRPDPEQQGRIQREAHAMARLSHPNVAQVYDVGEVDGQTFIAMEYVPGATLWSWQRVDRPWSEVLAMYLQVGDGLVAAHDAGIVHRDFKPMNVLVGLDGRPRVIDFGLARHAEAPPARSESNTGDDSPADALTRAGTMLGTPAYMAPEQLSGESADAASDQFAFCVSLFEALYGRAPFDRRSVATRLRAISEGRIRVPDDRRGVPDWLHRLITRGLSGAPADRWPSLAALLDDCRRDRRRDGTFGWRRRGALVVAFWLVVLLPVLTLVASWERPPSWSNLAVLDTLIFVGANAMASLGARLLPPSDYNDLVVHSLRVFAVLPAIAHLLGWIAGLVPGAIAPLVLAMLGAAGLGASRPGMRLPLAQAVIMLAAAMAAARWPQHAWGVTAGALGVLMVGAMLGFAWLERNARRAATDRARDERPAGHPRRPGSLR